MSYAATKKTVIGALEQMHLYGAIVEWAEPDEVAHPGRWYVVTEVRKDGSKVTDFLTGREVLAMNTGVCAALSAIYAGRTVERKGMFIRAELVKPAPESTRIVCQNTWPSE